MQSKRKPILDEKKVPANEENKKSSPLSAASKKAIVTALKQVEIKNVQQSLVDAALAGHTFPPSIRETLDSLQVAYKEHYNDLTIRPLLKDAIINFMNIKRVEQFQTLLAGTFQEADWNSAFLNCMRDKLKIKIADEPMVQAGIKDGKIYWRIMSNDKIIYDRTEVKNHQFSFNKDNTWLMSWELFRQFKDSGKRTSTVAITEDLFERQFNRNSKTNAKAVWNELKSIGVINSKNRLSHSWQAFPKKSLSLKSIGNLTYTNVAKALYSITNNQGNKEVIAAIPDAFIYRSDCNPKKWFNTSSVMNSEPKNEKNSSKLWDASIYAELKHHRDTEREVRRYGEKLNYDHIPSKDALNVRVAQEQKKCQVVASTYQANLERIQETIAQKKASTTAKRGAMTTRAASAKVTPEIKILQERAQNLENKIAEQTKLKQKMTSENDGETWWTIAIPQNLHKQGVTYLASSSSQRTSTQHPFLRDISAYLDILEQRPEDFSLTQDDYIKALGAFRYLYRSHCKQQGAINGTQTISQLPQTLFQDPEARKKIDQLFLDRMQRFLNKREGKKFSEEKEEKKSVVRKLPR